MHVLPRYEYDLPFFPEGRFAEAAKRGRDIVAEAGAIAREAYPDLEVASALPSRKAPAKVFLEESEHAHAVVLGAKGKGGLAPSATGRVGACRVSDCRHNADFECHAPGITVGYQQSEVGCLTYAPA